MNYDFQIVDFGSVLYNSSVNLREAILRKPLGMTFSEEDLANEKEQLHLVVAVDGAVHGVTLLKKINQKICKLRQFAVSEALQGKGLGRKLLQYFEEVARLQGYSIVELNARKSAYIFYEKLGYQVQGVEFQEVGIPHFKMTKKLSEVSP